MELGPLVTLSLIDVGSASLLTLLSFSFSFHHAQIH